MDTKQNVGYIPHAVDLAFAVTTWKSQGATIEYALALLEHSDKSPKLTFELLYVMCSRVRSAARFRCMSLSSTFLRKKIRELRPNIVAVIWRVDIGDDGFWHPSQSEQKTL